MARKYLEEFLYRGKAPDVPKEDPPTYHVLIGILGEDGFGKRRVDVSSALTPAQAAEQGYDIKTIVSEINTEVMEHNLALAAQHQQLIYDHDEVTASHELLEGHVINLSEKIEKLEVENSDLKTQNMEMATTIQRIHAEQEAAKKAEKEATKH